jgi:hypothetical protein
MLHLTAVYHPMSLHMLSTSDSTNNLLHRAVAVKCPRSSNANSKFLPSLLLIDLLLSPYKFFKILTDPTQLK